MGPTTHLSSLLFSTTTKGSTRSTRSSLLDHYQEVALGAPLPFTVGRNQPHRQELDQARHNKKCVLKQKMPGRPWGKMTTMQGGAKRAATSIRFAFRGNRSNHTVVSARRTWRNVFAKSLSPCDTKTPPRMLSCSSAFCLFIYYSMGSSTRLCQTEYV